MNVRNRNNSKVTHYLAINNGCILHPKTPFWDWSTGYKRLSEPLYSSSLILPSNFRQQQKLAYRYDRLRDIAIDVKSGLLAQIRKFKGIDQYGGIDFFPSTTIVANITSSISSLSTIIVYISFYWNPPPLFSLKFGKAIYFTKKTFSCSRNKPSFSASHLILYAIIE